MAAQLDAILGQATAPAVTDTVFDRSGGNAYLVEELAGAVAAGGDPADLPPSLGDVLLSRVDSLSAGGQKLLRTASVAGRAVPEPLLAQVAGLGVVVAYCAVIWRYRQAEPSAAAPQPAWQPVGQPTVPATQT